MVSRHNKLRDVLAESCRRAHLGVQVEMGNNLTNHSHTRPADLLVPNWVLGKAAAFDLSVTSPLNPTTLLEVRSLIGSVYHWWWSRMEPGEKRLWSPSLS